MMNKKTYRNKKGIEFQIEISFIALREGSDYWKYVVRATSFAGPGLDFMVVVRKRTFPEKLLADEFVFTDPLKEIQTHLDFADEWGADRFWPELEADWIVF